MSLLLAQELKRLIQKINKRYCISFTKVKIYFSVMIIYMTTHIV
jgi:hypothetical protein